MRVIGNAVVTSMHIDPYGSHHRIFQSGVERFHAIYCLRSEERWPIMDTVLSFLISAGIIAFGVWVVAGTIIAGWPWPWPLMGLLVAVVGLLSLYGSVRDARTP